MNKPRDAFRPAHRGRTLPALLWMLAAVFVVGLLVVYLWLNQPAGPPQLVNRPDVAEPGAALADLAPPEQLERLQQQLSDRIEQDQPLDSVIAQLRWFVGEQPLSAPGHAALGQALLYQGQHQSAYRSFATALNLDDQQPSLHTLAGTLARKLDNPAAAERHYRRAMALQPDVLKHDQHLASLLLAEQRSDEAVLVLQEAVEKSDQRPMVWLQLASAHRAAGDGDAAIHAMRQAVERSVLLEPEAQRRVVVNYAQLLLDAGRAQDAAAALRTLPRDQQLHHDALERFAQAYGQLGRPGAVAALYEEAVVLVPTDEQAAALAAQWYEKAGQPRKARAMIETLRQINPRSPLLP